MTIGERIKQAREEAGLSQSRLAKLIGVTRNAVSLWENDENDPATDKIRPLAEYLDKSPDWIISGKEDFHERLRKQQRDAETRALAKRFETNNWDPPASDDGLLYAGTVEAGAFRDVELYTDLDEQRRVAVPKDFVFPGVRQYAWDVKGDSMNLANILEGMYVIGADYIDFERVYGQPNNGDLVIVQRASADGALELTVKELHGFADRYELRPKSTNPKHKPIIIMRGVDEHVSTRLVAIVLGTYNRLKR